MSLWWWDVVARYRLLPIRIRRSSVYRAGGACHNAPPTTDAHRAAAPGAPPTAHQTLAGNVGGRLAWLPRSCGCAGHVSVCPGTWLHLSAHGSCRATVACKPWPLRCGPGPPTVRFRCGALPPAADGALRPNMTQRWCPLCSNFVRNPFLETPPSQKLCIFSRA